MRAPSKRSYLLKRVPELDLVPIMGLFVALVPFLLSVAIFTRVALIAMPMPKVAQTEDEIQKIEGDKWMLRVYVVDDKTKNQVRNAKGYVVDCSCFPKGPKFLPLTAQGAYDQAGLNEIMIRVKQINQKEKIVIITPGDFVAFEDLVLTLDATREVLPVSMEEDQAPRYELFPDVVLEEVES